MLAASPIASAMIGCRELSGKVAWRENPEGWYNDQCRSLIMNKSSWSRENMSDSLFHCRFYSTVNCTHTQARCPGVTGPMIRALIVTQLTRSNSVSHCDGTGTCVTIVSYAQINEP
jgi:hypothetical protein